MESQELGLQKMNNSLLPLEEAIKNILKNIKTLPSCELPIYETLGFTLAKPVFSNVDNPPTSVSSMDGYAIAFKDIKKNSFSLKCIGEVSAGNKAKLKVGPGETIRIFTGSEIPIGADTVVIQEDTNIDKTKSNKIKFQNNNIHKGQYIRKKGLDFFKGQKLIEKKTILNVRSIALAASAGVSWVSVIQKPKIAILSTGNELIRPGEFYKKSKNNIFSSNGIFLFNFIKTMGADPFYLPLVKDSIESIEKIADITHNCDLIVSSGGASVGDYDLIKKSFINSHKNKFELDFWKIAMRPGKPLFFGKLNSIPFLGLPGNPVSTGVCSVIFLQKIIKKFLGQQTDDNIVYLPLGKSLKENDLRKDFLRSKILKKKKGQTFVIPYDTQDSSQTLIFAKSDCFIIREPYSKKVDKNTPVPVLLLPELI